MAALARSELQHINVRSGPFSAECAVPKPDLTDSSIDDVEASAARAADWVGSGCVYQHSVARTPVVRSVAPITGSGAASAPLAQRTVFITVDSLPIPLDDVNNETVRVSLVNPDAGPSYDLGCNVVGAAELRRDATPSWRVLLTDELSDSDFAAYVQSNLGLMTGPTSTQNSG